VSLLAAVTADAGTNHWTFTGPPGGTVASVAFHPSLDGIALLGSARGVHLTLDDGNSWARVFDGDMNDMSTLLFDPTDHRRVFAIGNGLFRSTDEGRTFGASIAPADNMRWMTIANDGVLYAMNVFGRLFRTSDGGGQWTEIIPRPWSSSGIAVATLAVDPRNSDVVHVAFNGSGVYSSTDRGDTWSLPVPGGPGGRNVADAVSRLAVDPDDGAHVLAATPDGLLRSQDGGATWSTHLTGMSFAWVGFDPLVDDAVMAITTTGQIVRSLDGAESWPVALRPPRMAVYWVQDAALSALTPGKMLVATTEGPMYSEDGGATFFRRTAGFAAGTPAGISAANDGHMLAAMRFPAALYFRNGATWQPAMSAPLLENVPGSSRLRAVAVAPSDSAKAYAIDEGNRLLRSTDGGLNWIGPHAQFSNTNEMFGGVVVDPDDPLTVYLTGNGAVWRSADGGVTWESRGAGLPLVTRQIAISPSDPAVLYVIALTTPATAAVFVSTDSAQTFVQALDLPGDQISSITVHPEDRDTVFAVLPTVVARSTDRGAHWTVMEDFGLPGDGYVVGSQLLIDPAQPDTWILTSSQFDRGFLRTVDGGARWQSTAFNPGGVHSPFGMATLNPQWPGMVIGGTADGGLAEYEISPDLGVTITGMESVVVAGGTAIARISVRNEGPHAASAVHLTINVAGVLSSQTPDVCAVASGRFECELSAMQVGEVRHIDLALTVGSAIASGTLTALVTGHEPDAVSANNEAVAITMSGEHSDVGVTLAAVPTVTVGGSTNFVATVHNAGPHPSPDTYLQIEFPMGAFAASATPSQGSCVQLGTAPMTWNCELGSVNAGSSATLTLGVRGDAAATYTIEAGVVSGNRDPVSANDTAATQFIVRAAPAPPAPPSGGGGGGGSFDWLSLLLIAALARVRWPAARLRCSPAW